MRTDGSYPADKLDSGEPGESVILLLAAFPDCVNGIDNGSAVGFAKTITRTDAPTWILAITHPRAGSPFILTLQLPVRRRGNNRYVPMILGRGVNVSRDPDDETPRVGKLLCLFLRDLPPATRLASHRLLHEAVELVRHW